MTKTLTIISVITMFSLLYVHQQSEIFRLAYLGQKKLTLCEDLMNKNSVLKYNIEKNASLTNIGTKLSASLDFQIPGSYRMVRLGPAVEGAGINVSSPKRQNIFVRIFSVRRQAEAKTINP